MVPRLQRDGKDAQAVGGFGWSFSTKKAGGDLIIDAVLFRIAASTSELCGSLVKRLQDQDLSRRLPNVREKNHAV
jgi:hypothetical protein